MRSTSLNSTPHYSILKKFRRILAGSYILSLVIVIALISTWTRSEVYTSANKELTLLVDMLEATRTYINEDVKPYLLPQDIFYAPAVSPVVASKHITSHFLNIQPDYYFKVASDNPLNPANQPEPFERSLLQTFRANRELQSLVKEGALRGGGFLVSSKPSISNESCMICHGHPGQVREEIRTQYGNGSGYNYQENQVVGVSIVGVPIANVDRIIFKRSAIALGLLSLIFFVIFFGINQLVQRWILKPVIYIAAHARRVSEGHFDQPLITHRKDEIGELSHAFDLMRRSLETATMRLKKLSERRSDLSKN